MLFKYAAKLSGLEVRYLFSIKQCNRFNTRLANYACVKNDGKIALTLQKRPVCAILHDIAVSAAKGGSYLR